MSDDKQTKAMTKDKEEPELPIPWQRIQSAIWLLGLALIAWQGWWWPGILVLIAISGLTQGLIQLYLGRQHEQKEITVQQQNEAREQAAWLPAVCPTCGGPLSVSTVKWTGPNTCNCPYCSANLKPA